MTTLLFLDDSYLHEFNATIVDLIDGVGVVLDETAFYAGGGGQPADVGLLKANGTTFTVTGMKRQDGQIIHLIENMESLKPGTTVTGVIDWDRRYRLMRTHTALHVLCGVVFHEFGAQVTGGNMGTEKARMDFELEDLNADRIKFIEDRANEVIASDRAVTWKTLPRDEAFQIPDLIRTKINLLPPSIQEVRVVEIDGIDLQADGGTHVRQTGEVRGIEVIGTRSKGKANKRLEIALVDNESRL